MPTSLRAGSGSFGFGIRPMRGVLIAGRTEDYHARSIVNPAVDNGAFSITINGLQLIVRGSDGNQSGIASASDLIDGTGQALIDNFAVFSETDNLFYAMVYNAANEFRLVRANFNGSITTPGAKFTPASPDRFKGRSFCYESGNNIVMRVSYGNVIYQQVIAKANGQIVSQDTVLVTGQAMANAYYVSADGQMTFGFIDTPTAGAGADEGWMSVNGLSINGTRIPSIKLANMEVFGLYLKAVGQLYVAQSGKYISFLPVVAGGAQAPLPLIERTEFDRWLRDICNKFKYA